MRQFIKCIELVIPAIIVLCASTIGAFTLPEASVIVKVVNEEGKPIQNEVVTVKFSGAGRYGKDAYNETGRTDEKGSFIASHKTDGVVFADMVLPGYYPSLMRFAFYGAEKGKWMPWNQEMVLIMRRIINPVPMYARDTEMSHLHIPVIGLNVGFDLMEYSWMPPYGTGKHADFIFRLDKRWVNEDDFDSTLTLTFSSKFDGIQLFKEDRYYGSALKLPRYAPEQGYGNKLIRSIRRKANQMENDSQDDNNYIFRVRSEEKNGQIVRAMYGKIYGDIVSDPRSGANPSILFKYYLNPDFSRNLEYDVKNNLFKNMKSIEFVY